MSWSSIFTKVTGSFIHFVGKDWAITASPADPINNVQVSPSAPCLFTLYQEAFSHFFPLRNLSIFLSSFSLCYLFKNPVLVLQYYHFRLSLVFVSAHTTLNGLSPLERTTIYYIISPHNTRSYYVSDRKHCSLCVAPVRGSMSTTLRK